MTSRLIVLAGAVGIALGIAAPVASAEDPPQSAAAAAALRVVLDQRKLEAIAAPDPAEPGRFVAALYFPGSQLLVVSGIYSAPVLLDKRLADAKYMDVYLEIQGATTEGRFFVMDLQADGLKRVCGRDEPFDSTSRNGTSDLVFNGDWEAQKFTEAEYNTRFSEDDARYTHMLEVLAAALAPAKTPAPTRKRGR